MSLGVDIVPKKVCSLDCIYCQAGRTTEKTVEVKKWLELKGIIQEIEQALENALHVDYITFSGAGEPTLNLELGTVIEAIKKITSIPVCVITNSTLMYLDNVRQNLMNADLVIPSLDSAIQETFVKINRPHPLLDINNIIEGLKKFSSEYSGKIWFEIMLVKGINDSIEELQAIKRVTDYMKPDKVHINMVTRPSAESDIVSPDEDFLLRAKQFFGEHTEIIGDFQSRGFAPTERECRNEIIEMLKRRPCTLDQITESIGIDGQKAEALLNLLVKTHIADKEVKGIQEYYFIR